MPWPQQLGIGWRVAEKSLVRGGPGLVKGPNAVWISVAAEFAAKFIALFLRHGNLAVKPAEEVNELGVVVDDVASMASKTGRTCGL